MECNLKDIKSQDDLIDNLVECVSNQIKDFVNNEKNSKDGKDHSREKSWQHCYEVFQKYLKNETISKEETDFLALNLGFYLASFGMYRASGFLLGYDYKIHNSVIKELKEQKIKCGEFIDYSSYSDLKTKIDEAYKLYVNRSPKNEKDDKKENVKSKREENKTLIVTETLVTKILLGTFSCIPAFDENLKRVLKEVKNKLGKNMNQAVNEETITFLQELATKVEEKIEKESQYKEQKDYLQKNGYNKVRLLDLCM